MFGSIARWVLAGFCGAALAGCVGMGQYEIQSDRYVRYYCEGGRKFRVWYQTDRATAVLDLGDRSVSLSRVDSSGTGDFYSDGTIGLSVKDDIAVVEEGGTMTYTACLSG